MEHKYELPGYLLTQAQGAALERLAERFKTTPAALLSGAAPEFGNSATACLMVSIPSANLWVGIERDGYIHS
jgi:hypothetical protein